MTGTPGVAVARGRRAGWAALTIAAGLLAARVTCAGQVAAADAAPVAGASQVLAATGEKEQFTRLIQAQALACSWNLEGRVFAGQDLAGKGLELAVSEVKWDDERVYFTVAIAPPAEMQALLATHKQWAFPLAWSYSRTKGAAGEAPVLKLTEAVGTFPAPAPGGKSGASDWRKFIPRNNTQRSFPRPF